MEKVVEEVGVVEEEEQEQFFEDEEDDLHDEDDEEGEEYIFRFKEGVNPLDFVEDNALSGQPYKQFERLEYEALAEKKRKALADSHR